MIATFENSVDVLVKAYLNGTLEHMECHACAVGNLVAHAKGIKIIRDQNGCSWEKGLPKWYDVISFGTVKETDSYLLHGAKLEASVTGYTLEQLAVIENAFERAPGGDDMDGFDDTWMFNGLMAVVDVLAEIHGVDLTTKEQAIGRFDKIHITKA